MAALPALKPSTYYPSSPFARTESEHVTLQCESVNDNFMHAIISVGMELSGGHAFVSHILYVIVNSLECVGIYVTDRVIKCL